MTCRGCHRRKVIYFGGPNETAAALYCDGCLTRARRFDPNDVPARPAVRWSWVAAIGFGTLIGLWFARGWS